MNGKEPERRSTAPSSGRLINAEGKLQIRRWSKPDEDSDRFSTDASFRQP